MQVVRHTRPPLVEEVEDSDDITDERLPVLSAHMNICRVCARNLADMEAHQADLDTHAGIGPPPSASEDDPQLMLYQPFTRSPSYFQLLASVWQLKPATNDQTLTHLLTDTSHTASPTPPTFSDESQQHQQLPNTGFNEGYYLRFFREVGRLGRGARGSVFLCQHLLFHPDISTAQRSSETLGLLGDYAVKKIPVGDNRSWLVRMLGEVHTLERLRHFNIVEYKHCWLETCQPTQFGPAVPCLFILMELANGGNLEEYVAQRYPAVVPQTTRRRRHLSDGGHDDSPSQNHDGLSISVIWNFFLDVCSGLDHLHRHGIIHRDLKPSNLLLKYDAVNTATSSDLKDDRGLRRPRVLLSDFGECEDLFNEHQLHRRTGFTGTLEFTAPELLKTDKKGDHFVEYTSAADLWSLGMVLYFLCHGKLPFHSDMEDIDQLKREIRTTSGTFIKCERQDLPREIVKLIQLLLSPNPRDRPSAASILKSFAAMRFAPKSKRSRPHSFNSPVEPQQRLISAKKPTLRQRRRIDDDLDSKNDSGDTKSTEQTTTRTSVKPSNNLLLVAVLILSGYPYAPTMLMITIFIATSYLINSYPLWRMMLNILFALLALISAIFNARE